MTRPLGNVALAERGIALLAVLMALTLLLLLALPFSVSMSRGADVAQRTLEGRQAELLSASARDLMLGETVLGHPTYDPTPACDDRSEFPAGVPDTFPALRRDGNVRFGGETWDLQRFLALDAITPLLLTNLLGTTARLTQPLGSDDSSVQVDSLANLPDSGYVWVDHEVIHYGSKQGSALVDLLRGQFHELGFVLPKDHEVAATALVLDWRCVLATTWPFDGRTHGNRRERQAFAAPGELAEIEQAGAGGFTLQELDVLAATLAPATELTTAPQWGRPERVFYDLRPDQRTVTVKSALHLGAGSTVRLRNVRTGVSEHGLVMATSTPRGEQELLLPSTFTLELLQPPTQEFPAIDTVVEPLVPAPVNVNTADSKVLAALFAGCRRGIDVRVHDASGTQRIAPQPPFSAGDARDLAEQIVELRAETPFQGFQEFAEKLWQPRLKDASQEQKLRLLYLYRLLLTGRDSVVEMGTAPITFSSGPLVGYRAAASVQRSSVAASIAARHERTGIAISQPGLLLQAPLRTQEEVEEAFRIDQRAPGWLTGPVNTGAAGAGEPGNDPTSRYFAHVVAMAFPDAGLGQPRFPSRDTADTSIQASPASVVPGPWVAGTERRGHEAFATAIDPRGRDVRRDGPCLIRSTGPRDARLAPAPARTHELTFPFTTALSKGGAGRFAISAWFEPETLTGTLLDYSDGDPLRNRIALLVRDGSLVYEVVDEAGIDPDPSQSPAGIPRTATQWTLPLAELGLPPRTPLHVSMAAYGARPSDLSVAVDGLTRGEVKYRTRLTARVPAYDPQRSPQGQGQNQPFQPNQPLPGQPGSDPRYVILQVEKAEGFPPQGVLRIGLELFEYVEVVGNTFACLRRDSMGGRGVRQWEREMRPDIPVDKDGKPKIDLDQFTQGNNVDLFPEHPIGAEVELYGYSAVPSPDTLVFLGETQLAGGLGGFAVARGFLANARPIVINIPNGPSITVGTGLDPTWTGDLQLCDPKTTGSVPPQPAQQAIYEAFPSGGGYALLVQTRSDHSAPQGGLSVLIGGVEPIQYQSRQGTKLIGVQRAARLPGTDDQIDKKWYDGTAHNFVVDWVDNLVEGNSQPPIKFDDSPLRLLNVVPISFAVQDTRGLADPQATGTVEWLQLFPRGGNVNDTEWVRYDALVGQHVVRTNRFRWDMARLALTNQRVVDTIQMTPGGASSINLGSPEAIWGKITPTTDYIGYIPTVEGDFPQIFHARNALAFRGDEGTSSHPQPASIVTPCHRLDLPWGNFGAMAARPGRSDRVALVAGSTGSGTKRPAVEWHTVNWSAREYIGDLSRKQKPPELIGPDPFQLVAFQAGVKTLVRGRPRNDEIVDVRTYDRLVKFPSGELPAAACEWVSCGGTVRAGELMAGIVDEIDVTDQVTLDLVVDEAFNDRATQFLVKPTASVEPQGLRYLAQDLTQAFPKSGGLVQIDGEILAYQGHDNGTFAIARNARGLLNTDARGHDRGARVHFLSHRPAAILNASVTPHGDKLALQGLGALPSRSGTVLLNRTEMLHYAWVRKSGDQYSLEMPRSFPPRDDGDSTGARGLFRGRYGTTPVGASTSEPVIAMPFRYWDRFVPRNDDPEQHYFQITVREAPSYFRSIRWDEETADARVDIACLVRADARAAWTDDPQKMRFLHRIDRQAGDQTPSVIDLQATQLEVRFAVEYKPGCLDLATFRAHGWKTAPALRHIELEYDGELRILQERVTAR